MRARFVRVATVVLSALVLPLLTAMPAWARLDDGEAPTHTGWEFVVGVFIFVPIGFFLLLAAITFGTSKTSRPRYRPSREWSADAVWFNGPAEPARALASTAPAAVKGGGASASW